MKHPPLRIAIVYNLPSDHMLGQPFLATDEDTAHSAEEIAAALRGAGQQVQLVSVTADAVDTIGRIRADCIFDLIEWTGKDLQYGLAAVRAIEATGIPFTGASSENYHITSDKALMKQALIGAGLPVPPAQIFTTGTEPVDPQLRYPVILKPALEHCSIGLDRSAIVMAETDLPRAVAERIQRFHQPILAEEFIVGREFQVTVLETADGPTVLPPAEVLFKAGVADFLTYSSRWDDNHPDYHASNVGLTPLPPELTAAITDVARRTFIELGFRDYNRLDIRVRDGQVYILEANSNPGLDDSHEYGLSLSFHALGMSFGDFLMAIVHSALRRFTTRARGQSAGIAAL